MKNNRLKWLGYVLRRKKTEVVRVVIREFMLKEIGVEEDRKRDEGM